MEEVRGKILERFREKDHPVIMLTAHALAPEALKHSFEMGARPYLPAPHLAP